MANGGSTAPSCLCRHRNTSGSTLPRSRSSRRARKSAASALIKCWRNSRQRAPAASDRALTAMVNSAPERGFSSIGERMMTAHPIHSAASATRAKRRTEVRPPAQIRSTTLRMRTTPVNERFPALPALLLFLSGMAALVYQILWVKQLALIVGVDVYAVTTGISAFFAGLALGGALFGRRADLSARPLRLFAALEAGTSLLGVAVTLIFGSAAPVFAALEGRAGLLAWVPLFVMIGLPALLMGGTLPALVRAVAPADDAVGLASGNLYSMNTAGAIAGALVATFVFVPLLGLRGSAVAAAGLNLLAAALALAADRRMKPRVPRDASRTRAPNRVSLALGLYGVAGGIALGYEVVWTQTVVQFLSTRAFAFTIVLVTYLAGLFLGSLACSKFADRIRRPWVVLGCLLAAAGASALLLVAGIGPWL